MRNQKLSKMGYIATARKWRPLLFDDVVGQEHIITTLKNAFQANRLHHAYLFSGPRGVGKTTTARIFARLVNCKNPKNSEPCNECDNCKAILEGNSLDVLEIDGASNNSVDDIRTLRENAKYPPSLGKYKLYIIDEVHMLSTSAFNALLKILEEPPKHLIFIFATTELHKVLPTIQSRCQRFEFRRIEIDTIKKQIAKIASAENIQIDEPSLYTIAKKADGSMRDAQSIFDQFVANAGNNIQYQKVKEILHLIDEEYYFKVSEAYINHNVKLAFEVTDEIVYSGFEFSEFLSGLLEHFRNLLVLKSTLNPSLLSAQENLRERFSTTAENFNIYDLIRIMNLITQTEQQIRYLPNPRFRIELLLVQIIEMPKTIEISELIKKIDEIKFLPSAPLQPKDNIHQEHHQSFQQTQTESSVTMQQGITTEKSWDAFLEKYGKQLNGLQTYTNNGIIDVTISVSEVLIKVFNQFAYDNLNSKFNQIRQAIREFFGSNFALQLILVEKELALPESGTNISFSHYNDNSSSMDTNLQGPENENQMKELDSELVQKIVNLFDAKEINFG